MSTVLHTPNDASASSLQDNLQSLEEGKILYLPNTAPEVDSTKRDALEADILDGKHKNLSFDAKKNRLGGLNKKLIGTKQEEFLHAFMDDYSQYAFQLLCTYLPFYQDALLWGRTSYRPMEILGRNSSKRKDDTRLHVDAFPSTPVNGNRILRVFSNINFDGKSRDWMVGEPFSQVLNTFYPRITPYRKNIAKLMHLIKATKSLRSNYDHTMLQLHDRMKLDDQYQQQVNKTPVSFPALSSWVVFTDHVSHAALGGQYLLEQSFYLPVAAMANPKHSPMQQIADKQLQTAAV